MGELGGLLFLVVIGTSIWVAVDAPQHGLSWTWGLGCFLLWIVAFPWYLVERGKQTRAVVPAAPPSVPPEGWYPDPHAPSSQERYWAGGQWTQLTRPRS